jgi:hypothetical protein
LIFDKTFNCKRKQANKELKDYGKLNFKSSLKEPTKIEIMPIETQEVYLPSKTVCSKKIKPRAIVFKANDKDLDKLKELINVQFPEVEIIYVTTGPASSILRITKSIPNEPSDSSSELLYTIE